LLIELLRLLSQLFDHACSLKMKRHQNLARSIFVLMCFVSGSFFYLVFGLVEKTNVKLKIYPNNIRFL